MLHGAKANRLRLELRSTKLEIRIIKLKRKIDKTNTGEIILENTKFYCGSNTLTSIDDQPNDHYILTIENLHKRKML